MNWNFKKTNLSLINKKMNKMRFNLNLWSSLEWTAMNLKKNKTHHKKSLLIKQIQLEAFQKWKVKKSYIDQNI